MHGKFRTSNPRYRRRMSYGINVQKWTGSSAMMPHWYEVMVAARIEPLSISIRLLGCVDAALIDILFLGFLKSFLRISEQNLQIYIPCTHKTPFFYWYAAAIIIFFNLYLFLFLKIPLALPLSLTRNHTHMPRIKTTTEIRFKLIEHVWQILRHLRSSVYDKVVAHI